jgi:hypothetical protein
MRSLFANNGPMQCSKLHLYLTASAGTSLGEAIPARHTGQHKIHRIGVIVS